MPNKIIIYDTDRAINALVNALTDESRNRFVQEYAASAPPQLYVPHTIGEIGVVIAGVAGFATFMIITSDDRITIAKVAGYTGLIVGGVMLLANLAVRAGCGF